MKNPRPLSISKRLEHPQTQQACKATTGYLLFATGLVINNSILGTIGIALMLHALLTLFDNHSKGIR